MSVVEPDPAIPGVGKGPGDGFRSKPRCRPSAPCLFLVSTAVFVHAGDPLKERYILRRELWAVGAAQERPCHDSAAAAGSPRNRTRRAIRGCARAAETEAARPHRLPVRSGRRPAALPRYAARSPLAGTGRRIGPACAPPIALRAPSG